MSDSIERLIAILRKDYAGHDHVQEAVIVLESLRSLPPRTSRRRSHDLP